MSLRETLARVLRRDSCHTSHVSEDSCCSHSLSQTHGAWTTCRRLMLLTLTVVDSCCVDSLSQTHVAWTQCRRHILLGLPFADSCSGASISCRALWKRLYSAKETYNFKEPTYRTHPIFDTSCGRCISCRDCRSTWVLWDVTRVTWESPFGTLVVHKSLRKMHARVLKGDSWWLTASLAVTVAQHDQLWGGYDE